MSRQAKIAKDVKVSYEPSKETEKYGPNPQLDNNCFQKLIGKFFSWFSKSKLLDASTDDAGIQANWKLTPLTPEYDEIEHGPYVKAINEALHNKAIHNIALSGGYGVGKSSILEEFARSHGKRVIKLSLSTLAPLNSYSDSNAVPEQATTTTNRIQQEIVKQLLYREDPSKTPESRFRRIERFRFLRELVIAGLIGLSTSVVFLLTGWTHVVVGEFAPRSDVGAWVHGVVVLAIGLVTLIVRRLFHGRIRINQLSTAAATVTLDDKSTSYFDQYLDEIVYFFEVSQEADIVIFEDIDRFNDAHIFETIRSLNILLNESPQISKRNSIRFIYAIRDSIFDRLGIATEGRAPDFGYEGISDDAHGEIIRANRTKFFDLVIPVVPFITHLNAKSLAHELLDEIEHSIDPLLIDLAAKHVPDMRLLKNVRNEFIVFRERLFSGEGENLQLSQTELFAMMLYKCTHLSDFEKIRINQSKLDHLYEVWREIVAVNIQAANSEIRRTRNRLKSPDTITKQSQKLGDRLLEMTQFVASTCRYNYSNGQYQFDGQVFSEDDLRSTEFWSKYVQNSPKQELTWVNTNNRSQIVSFSRSQLSTFLNTRLEPEEWNKPDIDDLKTTLQKLQEDLVFLKRADMGDILKRADFESGESGESDARKSLATIAREVLSSELAYELVQSGYIRQNFTLYTSTFHGNRVTSAATNFIIHHVQRNIMDEYFILTPNDVDAVIGEVGTEMLSEPAMYNISIMDHLLRNDRERADLIIRSLADMGSLQQRFIQAYLGGASERLEFAKRFAGATGNVFELFITEIDLDISDRLKIVSSALEGLNEKIEYRANTEVIEYLSENYAEIDVLTISPHSTGLRLIAKFFHDADITVSDLALLSENARQVFIAHNLYQINKKNLEVLFANETSMSLDTALQKNKAVYTYLTDNITDYLSAVEGLSCTISNGEYFLKIVEDILKKHPDQLSTLIVYSAENCTITDIVDAPEEAWSALAQNKRFPATFSNLSNYVNLVGSIDSNLANILNNTDEITEHESIDEEDKTSLAVMIIAASEHISSASHRSKLVCSLALEDYLAVDSLPLEKGDLFSQLIMHNIINDNAETFRYLLSADWPTRQQFIKHSQKFNEYIEPDLLKVGDITLLLDSDEISFDSKAAVVDLVSADPAISSGDDLKQIASFSLNQQLAVSIQLVESMAQNSVPSQHVIKLLRPHLKSITQSQLFAILEALPGDYAELTTVGAKQPKIPDSTGDRELLDTLKRFGIVSRYKQDSGLLKVYKKRKSNT